MIYETAVICRRIGWFPVFCARRRTNGGGYAEVLNLLPFSIQEQWGGYILLYMPLCYLCSAVFPNLFLASAPFSDKQSSIAPYHA